MNPTLRTTLAFALLAAFGTVLVGCGSKEEEKPSAATGYYDGEMKPKVSPGEGGKTGAE